MARELMPKSGIMIPCVVTSMEPIISGVASIDGKTGSITLSDTYLSKTECEKTYLKRSETFLKKEIDDKINPISQRALYKDDPFINNSTPIRSKGGNGIDSVDMIKVSPDNKIVLGDNKSGLQGTVIHSTGNLKVVDKDDAGRDRESTIYSSINRPSLSDLPFASIGDYQVDGKGNTIGVNKTGVNSDIKKMTGLEELTKGVISLNASNGTNVLAFGPSSGNWRLYQSNAENRFILITKDGNNITFPNSEGTLALKEDTYTKKEVDQILAQFASDYTEHEKRLFNAQKETNEMLAELLEKIN